MNLKTIKRIRCNVWVIFVALVLWIPNAVFSDPSGGGQVAEAKGSVVTSGCSGDVVTGLHHNLLGALEDFLNEQEKLFVGRFRDKPEFKKKYFERIYALLTLLSSYSQGVLRNPKAGSEAKTQAQGVMRLLATIEGEIKLPVAEFNAELERSIFGHINEFLSLVNSHATPRIGAGVETHQRLLTALKDFLNKQETLFVGPFRDKPEFKKKYFERIYVLLTLLSSYSQGVLRNPKASSEAKTQAQGVIELLATIEGEIKRPVAEFNAELERRLFGYIENFLQLVGVRAGSEAQRVGSNSGAPRTEDRIPEKQPSVSPATTPSAKLVPQMVERREGASAASTTEPVQQTTPQPSTPEQPADSSSTPRSTPEVHQEQSDDKAERPLSSSRRSTMNCGLIARLGDENTEVILGVIESVYVQLQDAVLELQVRLSNRDFALEHGLSDDEKRYPEYLELELSLGLAYVNLAEGWLEAAQGVSDRLIAIDTPKIQLTDNLTVLKMQRDRYIQLLNKKVPTKEALQHKTDIEALKKDIDEFLDKLEQAEIEIIYAIRDAEIRRIEKESKEESDTGSRAKTKKVVGQVEEGTPVYPRRIPHGSTLTDWIYEGIQQLEKGEAHIRRLKARLAAARKDEKEIQLTLAVSQEQIEQLQEEKGKNEAEISRLTQELEAEKNKAAELEQAKGALEEQKSAAEQAKSDLEAKQKDLEDQLEAEKNKAAEAKKKAEELQGKLVAKENERAAAQQEEAQTANEEMTRLRTRIADLEKLLAAKNEQIGSGVLRPAEKPVEIMEGAAPSSSLGIQDAWYPEVEPLDVGERELRRPFELKELMEQNGLLKQVLCDVALRRKIEAVIFIRHLRDNPNYLTFLKDSTAGIMTAEESSRLGIVVDDNLLVWLYIRYLVGHRGHNFVTYAELLNLLLYLRDALVVSDGAEVTSLLVRLQQVDVVNDQRTFIGLLNKLLCVFGRAWLVNNKQPLPADERRGVAAWALSFIWDEELNSVEKAMGRAFAEMMCAKDKQEIPGPETNATRGEDSRGGLDSVLRTLGSSMDSVYTYNNPSFLQFSK